jgi:hypothetical protein
VRSIDTSTPEGAALFAWQHPSCTLTTPHPLGECPRLAPASPAVGDYIEIECRSKRETSRAVVLVTSLEQREGYVYVGWRNAQPGGGWDRHNGSWGFFRQYPAEREYGTSIVAVL